MEFLRRRNDVRVLGPVDSVARAHGRLDIGRNAEEFAATLATTGIMAGVVIFTPCAPWRL